MSTNSSHPTFSMSKALQTSAAESAGKGMHSDPPHAHKGKPISFFVWAGITLVSVIGLFTSSTDIAGGLWCVALMVALMFLGVPISLSLVIASAMGIYYVSGTTAMVNVMSSAPFTASSNWAMTVLPMFILMGLLLTQSGLTQKIYRATELWFGWLPGGLGIGTTFAGAGLASVSGSSIGMTYALGRAGIPEMLKAGYDKRIATGTVIIAGLPGQLIPPSILLVVYAGIASVPVGPQLMAGVIPGIGIALAYALMLLVLGIVVPKLMGRGVKGAAAEVTWGERFRVLASIWGFPAVMLVLFGGMFTGLFTPSEAGAAAAAMAVVLTFVYLRRDQPLQQILTATVGAVKATASVFFILIGAEMLTRMLSVTGLAEYVTEFLADLGLSRFLFLAALIVLYIFMGMFFDTMSMMLLTIPILLPTLAAYDIDLLWFGVFVVLLGELGMITPPVGVLTYIVHNLTKRPEVNQGVKVSLGDVFMSLAWFLPLSLLFLILLILWPDLATWLPSVSNT